MLAKLILTFPDYIPITESKDRYIATMIAKLDNPKSVPKTYWSIIKQIFK